MWRQRTPGSHGYNEECGKGPPGSHGYNLECGKGPPGSHGHNLECGKGPRDLTDVKTIAAKDTRIFLFFLWFPLCRSEADLLVTVKYGYFRNLIPLVPVVGLFSPFVFLLCLSQIYLHTVLPSKLLSSSTFSGTFFVSARFGSLSSFIRTMCPAHFIRLLTILPTTQGLVPNSSRRSFILRLTTLLTPAIFLIQLFSHSCSLC